MAHVHHFTYGAFNPIAAYLLAFLGSFLGLLCASRARDARSRGRRNRWLVISAFALGGGGIWLMHFSAMLGFDVPASPVRYDIKMTLLSMVFAVVTVGTGLMVVGHGRRSPARIAAAGALTGSGVLAMHYTGMEGMRVAGHIRYDLTLVAASILIAFVACSVALWCAVSIRGWARTIGAAAVMAVAICGMHYTGMAAMSVELGQATGETVSGIRPLTMIVPITLITAIIAVGVALSALQAMTEEEFTDGEGTPRRGLHAEHSNPWSLRQTSLTAVRSSVPHRVKSRPSPAPRPAPRPTPATAPTAPGS